MIRLTEILKWYHYIGDCKTGLEHENFQIEVADDATELAQLIENSKNMSKNSFAMATGISNEDAEEFGYNEDRNVVWSYNQGEDLHKFYVR